MKDLTRNPGLFYISWNDWVAMGQQRSAMGFLAEWLETSPRSSKSMLLSAQGSDAEQAVAPGILACCPDVSVGRLTDAVSTVETGASVLALFPEEKVAEELVDAVDPTSADLCITLWPGFDDLELWLRAHAAVELPSGMIADQGFVERVPAVVRVALSRAGEVMDQASGLKHGRGKDQIVQTLQLLHNSGYRYEPQDLELYAYRLGYRQRDVRQLGDYIKRVHQNRRIVTGESRLRDDILEQWEAEAKEL
ncbi:hypothetical protein OOZ51_00420 [Arthrobacter sp. MI7-26]|uniref:hypothetical protein n=1 Tax=Arthrobacter sp. MI7-26 TaxID=2993653 RepID=UPI0022492A51|nr:hypothetical protein [Arthrobacter sp. MI7-26]MCX2746276.1 hypothetical protein [Arthrobacter sp. MI7-26]